MTQRQEGDRSAGVEMVRLAELSDSSKAIVQRADPGLAEGVFEAPKYLVRFTLLSRFRRRSLDAYDDEETALRYYRCRPHPRSALYDKRPTDRAVPPGGGSPSVLADSEPFPRDGGREAVVQIPSGRSRWSGQRSPPPRG